MTLTIFKCGDKYHVTVSPPEGPLWRSAQLLSATEILETLSGMGCHSTDITDALFDADPEWALRHDAGVVRRRREQGQSS